MLISYIIFAVIMITKKQYHLCGITHALSASENNISLYFECLSKQLSKEQKKSSDYKGLKHNIIVLEEFVRKLENIYPLPNNPKGLLWDIDLKESNELHDKYGNP